MMVDGGIFVKGASKRLKTDLQWLRNLLFNCTNTLIGILNNWKLDELLYIFMINPVFWVL